METPAEIQERLRGDDVSLVALHFSDMAGMSRTKVIPLRRLETVARSGTGWSDIWAVVCIDEHFAEVPPYDTPSGDARLVPDVSQARALPFLPGYAWAPVDQFSQELEPLPACPRHVLRLAQDRLAAAGLAAQATYEVEMTLLRDGVPATAGPGYSVRAFVAIRDFLRDFATALESVDVPVEQLHPEYSPGQFEVSLAPSTPLEAADRLLLFRFTARAVAAEHGMDVSFAPVVFTGGLGNGSHMHLSLWRDDENRMTGGDAPGGMQADGASFVAGIRDELPALMAVVAPSVPSYVRLQPGHWSGAYTAWGIENREASLRFIPGTVTSRSRSANVELKVTDGAANPYLALAAVLQAGLAGVEREATLPRADAGGSGRAGHRDAGGARHPAPAGEPGRGGRGVRRLDHPPRRARHRPARRHLRRAAQGVGRPRIQVGGGARRHAPVRVLTRFAANVSFLWAELPFLERFAAARAAGFDTVELHWPRGENLDDVAAAVADAGLAVCLMNFDGGDPEAGERGLMALPERQNDWRRHVPIALDLARRIGCPDAARAGRRRARGPARRAAGLGRGRAGVRGRRARPSRARRWWSRRSTPTTTGPCCCRTTRTPPRSCGAPGARTPASSSTPTTPR